MDIKEEASLLLDNGIKPFSYIRTTVYNSASQPTAYRCSLKLNSSELGSLSEEDYQEPADRSKRGILLARKALTAVNKAMDIYSSYGDGYSFISAKMPETFLTKTNSRSELEKIFGKEEKKLSRLMLEFPSSILFSMDDTMKEYLKELKDMGVRIALNSFGDPLCPTMKIAEFDFDYVILHETASSAFRLKELPKATELLLSLLYGLRIQVIVPDLLSENEIKLIKKSNCYGYTVRNKYEYLLGDDE